MSGIEPKGQETEDLALALVNVAGTAALAYVYKKLGAPRWAAVGIADITGRLILISSKLDKVRHGA